MGDSMTYKTVEKYYKASSPTKFFFPNTKTFVKFWSPTLAYGILTFHLLNQNQTKFQIQI